MCTVYYDMYPPFDRRAYGYDVNVGRLSTVLRRSAPRPRLRSASPLSAIRITSRATSVRPSTVAREAAWGRRSPSGRREEHRRASDAQDARSNVPRNKPCGAREKSRTSHFSA